MKRALVTTILALLVPAAAFASGGHHEELFFEKLGIQIADFLVVIIPLLVILIPLVRRSLKKRHDEVKAMLDESRAVHQAAMARLDAAEKSMQEIDREMASIRQNFVEMGESEKKALQANALETVQKMQTEAETRINQAGLAMQAQLTDELITRAIEQVEQKLATDKGKALSDDIVDRVTS